MNHITRREVDSIVTAVGEQLAAEAATMSDEAECDRLQACADQHRADNLPLPESYSIRDEMLDAGYEVAELGAEEIIELGKEYGLTLPQLVKRLEVFIAWAREQS